MGSHHSPTRLAARRLREDLDGLSPARRGGTGCSRDTTFRRFRDNTGGDGAAGDDPGGRLALAALWRRIKASGIAETQANDPGALLDLPVWCGLWHRSAADDIAESTRRQYERTARQILLRHAARSDPRRGVMQAWKKLRPQLDTELAPVRAAAAAALLRPQELDSDRLAAALTRLDDEPVAVVAARPGPIAAAWQELRAAARSRGFDTSRRESRSIMRELYTRALELRLADPTTPFADLLRCAVGAGLNGRKLRKTERLLYAVIQQKWSG